ncbi:MAG: sigma 54-interacting transcriptional regulator, partial [Gammaproteobacteria bacterium]|nr:sigma 54-interacting transcriptional regulator [Gammaproteobacteria bacterium]
GTLFLDEIGDMPLALQAKLLRFLQERVVERVGGRDEIPVDVRVVCATNQDLDAGIRDGRFRQDLFYRISEITIRIPPLREREGGRLVLARTLLEKASAQHGRRIAGFSPDARNAIENYAWPGTVREMENKIKGAVIMAEGKQVTAADLGIGQADASAPSLNLREVRREAETRAIRRALASANDNVSQAAKLLGITRPTLYDLMEKYGIQATDTG